MMPYRLEMGTKLANPKGRDLYSFWGDTITDVLLEDLEASPGAKVLINLASNEYFGSVRPARLGVPIVTPAFLDTNTQGDQKIVSFFAKRARGAMTAWIIKERLTSAKALRDFEGLGYRFDAEQSTGSRPVFTRDPHASVE